jgi:phosphoribosylanthranilate isomerase
MTMIKICGIKSEENALLAAEAGADFIGLVFASSPRQVTPAQAKNIVAALKKNKATVKAVGVFVNMPTPTVRKITDTCHLDWAQMSGDEPWEYCLDLSRPVIKVIKVGHDNRPESVSQQLASGAQMLTGKKHIFLLDANDGNKYGGTGLTFDWNLAKPVAEKFPVIIAGGLNPENVGRAIKLIRPWGVDVSTGVETKGIKDMKKVIKFIEAVRETDANQA